MLTSEWVFLYRSCSAKFCPGCVGKRLFRSRKAFTGFIWYSEEKSPREPLGSVPKYFISKDLARGCINSPAKRDEGEDYVDFVTGCRDICFVIATEFGESVTADVTADVYSSAFPGTLN